MNAECPALLRLRLSASYGGRPALRAVSLAVRQGEIVALIGQSGSGKSTLALAILGLLGMRGGRVEGSIEFEGRELAGLSERRMREVRGARIGLVFQSGAGALNPWLTVEDHLVEAWRAHASGHPDTGRLLSEVSLPSGREFRRKYPGELSAGQAQRVLIALGIVHRPPLLIADEPTSALDAITQAEILGLFGKLNRELGTAILLITHDLLSVARTAHRVAILHEGTLVEQGPCREIFTAPRQEYTRSLIGALPVLPETLAGQLGNLDRSLQDEGSPVDEFTRVAPQPGISFE